MIQSKLLLSCGYLAGFVLSVLLPLSQSVAESNAPVVEQPENQGQFLQYATTLGSEQVRTLYAEASWVSYVQVSQVRQRVDVALSVPGMYALEGYIYNLLVLNQWKGDGAGVAQLDVAVKDCPLMLEEAGEYIVFAQGVSGSLISNECMQMVAYQANSQTVEVLNNLYRQSLAVGP